MFVTSIEYNMTGDGYHTIDNPDWAVVAEKIRVLDGINNDVLTLNESPNGSYMGIAGGENNEYAVEGFLETQGHFILAAGQGKGKIKYLQTCHDDTPYADFEVVDIDIVLQVAEAFYFTGKLLPQFQWNNRLAARK